MKKRRRRTHKKRTHKHKRTYKKRNQHEITIIPNAKSIPLFTAPEKKLPQTIRINKSTNKQFGNIIPGLRELTK
jgi:hypothetical protein